MDGWPDLWVQGCLQDLLHTPALEQPELGGMVALVARAAFLTLDINARPSPCTDKFVVGHQARDFFRAIGKLINPILTLAKGLWNVVQKLFWFLSFWGPAPLHCPSTALAAGVCPQNSMNWVCATRVWKEFKTMFLSLGLQRRATINRCKGKDNWHVKWIMLQAHPRNFSEIKLLQPFHQLVFWFSSSDFFQMSHFPFLLEQ